jgi:hypothetical protein
VANSVSHKGGKFVLIIQGILWKNNLTFVYDAPMKFVNVIVIVNKVSEKKRGCIFIPTFVVNQNFDNPSYNGGREKILIRQIDKRYETFSNAGCVLACKLQIISESYLHRGFQSPCSLLGLHNQQFYALPTQCIYVFCVDLRTNSEYIPIQY